MEDQLENVIGALVILRQYAKEGTSLRHLIEDSFQRPVEDIERELALEVACINNETEK